MHSHSLIINYDEILDAAFYAESILAGNRNLDCFIVGKVSKVKHNTTDISIPDFSFKLVCDAKVKCSRLLNGRLTLFVLLMAGYVNIRNF